MADIFPILAPASGRLVAPQNITNAFLSNRLLGVGPVINVSNNHIVACFDGEISDISSSGDFIRLTGPQHVLVTLMLGQGNDFQRHPAITRHCRTGDSVKAGQTLLTLNQSLLRAGDAQQRQLSVLVETNAKLSWPVSGAISMYDPLIFEQEVMPK